MHTQLTPNDLVPLIIIVAMLALLPVACMKGMAKQAEAEYEQCLSWQADGYNVRCGGRP